MIGEAMGSTGTNIGRKDEMLKTCNNSFRLEYWHMALGKIITTR